jgi:hypothetical protein
MLQSLKQLHGYKLGASDGHIGHVMDFYFDDQNWAVRYVVADTGNWLPGRQVLLSPHAFNSTQAAVKTMLVNLTRKQIEDSPSIETHKPVSRHYEQEYHRFYGWPGYWIGDGLWGSGKGFPVLEMPYDFYPCEPAADQPKPKCAEAELRSTQAVSGYHLQATDGIIGHVCDFLMDNQSWAIKQLVVKTGHRFTGKEVQVPVSQVERISYKDSTVFVRLTQDAVEKSPEYQLFPNGAVNPNQPALAL